MTTFRKEVKGYNTFINKSTLLAVGVLNFRRSQSFVRVALSFLLNKGSGSKIDL